MGIARTNWFKPAAALAVLLLLLGVGLAAAALTDSNVAAHRAVATTAPQARASGAGASDANASKDPSDHLVVLSQAGPKTHIRLLQPGRADSAQERPLGFLSPDGSTIYAVEEGRNKTTVQAYDLVSGRKLRQTVLDGQYYVPDEVSSRTLAISGDGRRMLLRRAATESQLRTWKATGKPRGEFAVLGTDFKRPPVLIDLAGEFWFDALSRDGRWLYLIEIQDKYPMSYSPEKAPNYQVRAYDVDGKRLLPEPIVDKRELGEQMTGYRRASVYSRDGNWLYSLYTRADEELFIHALNLANQTALCIDLPFPGSRDFEADLMWSMAVSGDGKMLYAINGMTGQVVQVDLVNGHSVRKSATLALKPAATGQEPIQRALAAIGRWLVPSAEAKIVRVPGAVLGPGGQTLFATGRRGLLAIDTRELKLLGHYLTDLELNSLATGSGGTLYTVAGTQPDPGRLLVVNSQTGELLDEVEGVGPVWAVLQARQP